MFERIRRWLTHKRIFRRFTDCSRVALALANRFALQSGADSIVPLHILYGLLDLGLGSNACQVVLSDLSIDTEQLMERLLPTEGLQEIDARCGKLRPSQETNKLIEMAICEATAMRHKHITTGHILLGVLLCGDKDAVELLLGQGVTQELVRDKLRAMSLREARRLDRWP